MAKLALIVSKNRPDLDNRFQWVSSLKDIDTTMTPAIIYQSSTDSEEDVLRMLSVIHKKDANKKFLYVSSEPTPLLSMFFDGINGDTYDDDVVLSDADVLICLLEDYNKNDIKRKNAQENFQELAQAMQRILSGDLDEEELHAIITNADWLNQVKASMDTTTTSLVQVKNSNTALVNYVNVTRSALSHMQEKIIATEDKLKEALRVSESTATAQPNENVISHFPTVTTPVAANKILYIKEYSHCNYLVSFLMAYMNYLRTQRNVKMRLLIIHPKTECQMKHYPREVFFDLNNDSLTSSDLRMNRNFVTSEPKKNIFDAFFDTTQTDFFVVVDRFESSILLKAPAMNKMQFLYAVGSERIMNQYSLDPKKVIRHIEGDRASFVLPYIPQYSSTTIATARTNFYYTNCSQFFERLDEMFGFDEDD